MRQPTNVGVVLLQLGTPDAPTTSALRRYLAEFLSDPRVIELPRLLWWPILHGIILRVRPRKSAALYRKVWLSGGSPLAVTSAAQAAGLASRLKTRFGVTIPVEVGMRYGRPSVTDAVDALRKRGVDRILAFPMYPQYAGATTGSSLERLFDDAGGRRVVPSIRVVPPYYDDPLYIGALAATARETLDRLSARPDRILLSFHGIPKRYANSGDPYPAHCEASARAFAAAIGFAGVPVTLAFQSRFGREEWLQPYLDERLPEYGRAGERIAVACPGFTADCLETIEEIGIRGKEQFMAAGGLQFTRIPCLNDHPTWLDAMTEMAARELAGWAG